MEKQRGNPGGKDIKYCTKSSYFCMEEWLIFFKPVFPFLYSLSINIYLKQYIFFYSNSYVLDCNLFLKLPFHSFSSFPFFFSLCRPPIKLLSSLPCIGTSSQVLSLHRGVDSPKMSLSTAKT